jgi:diaminopimelate epimerase
VNSTVRTIPFVKAGACGNDFLLIDGALAPQDVAGFTRRICDRHNGVGADGVEWMIPHFTADVEIRLINADGSAAEISGNGTRCVAAYVCAQLGKERISILTGAGMKICQLTSRLESEYEFEIEMGEAVVENEVVLRVVAGEVRGVPVSVGNPHFVTFVPEFATNWQAQAVEIQRSPLFPQGVNVELVAVDSKFDVRAVSARRNLPARVRALRQWQRWRQAGRFPRSRSRRQVEPRRSAPTGVRFFCEVRRVCCAAESSS